MRQHQWVALEGCADRNMPVESQNLAICFANMIAKSLKVTGISNKTGVRMISRGIGLTKKCSEKICY
jgi:hypothetical protein